MSRHTEIFIAGLLLIAQSIWARPRLMQVTVARHRGVLELLQSNSGLFLALQGECNGKISVSFRPISLSLQGVHTDKGKDICTTMAVDPTAQIMHAPDHNGCLWLITLSDNNLKAEQICPNGDHNVYQKQQVGGRGVGLHWVGRSLMLIHNLSRPGTKRIGFGRVLKLTPAKGRLEAREFKFAVRVRSQGVHVRGWRLEDACWVDGDMHVIGLVYQTESEVGGPCSKRRWKHFLVRLVKGVWMYDFASTFGIDDWVRGLRVTNDAEEFVWWKNGQLYFARYGSGHTTIVKATFVGIPKDETDWPYSLALAGWTSESQALVVDPGGTRFALCEVDFNKSNALCTAVELSRTLGQWTHPVVKNHAIVFGVSADKTLDSRLIVLSPEKKSHKSE